MIPATILVFPFLADVGFKRESFVNYSKKCPGLKVLKGKHYTREEILDWATKEYEMEKDFFFEMKKNDFNIFKVYSFLPKDMVS